MELTWAIAELGTMADVEDAIRVYFNAEACDGHMFEVDGLRYEFIDGKLIPAE